MMWTKWCPLPACASHCPTKLYCRGPLILTHVFQHLLSVQTPALRPKGPPLLSLTSNYAPPPVNSCPWVPLRLLTSNPANLRIAWIGTQIERLLHQPTTLMKSDHLTDHFPNVVSVQGGWSLSEGIFIYPSSETILHSVCFLAFSFK